MTTTKKQDTVELGDPPWDEKILRRSYFRSFMHTREIVRTKHPGASVHAELELSRLSLNIFLNAVEDLIASINKFKGESSKPGFWNRPSRKITEELEISIQRGIASSAMCAMALVDHTRRFEEAFPVPDYCSQLVQYLENNQEHHFVQSLRNYITHYRITKASWNITHSSKGRSVFFLLNQADLLKWRDWHSVARQYVNNHPEGINVEDLFDQYSSGILSFHNWLRSAVMDCYGLQVSDYLRYKRILNGFDAENNWNMLLKQVLIQNKLDPYMYLDRYLTKDELENVLSLPHRSKGQVDRIIELIDEYGACTEKMRKLVYELFKVRGI